MQIRPKSIVILLALFVAIVVAPFSFASDPPFDVDQLVRGFPTLDELESRLGAGATPESPDAHPAAKATVAARADVFPVSARWFTAPPPPDPFTVALTAGDQKAQKSVASLLKDMEGAQADADALGKQIARQNDLPINKYLLDRFAATARTDYGTDVTGLFVNGIGFGTFQQSLLQNYGVAYTLPLLLRYGKNTKWKRILSGWTFSTSVAAMPQLGQAFQLKQLLNNLQLTWDVALSYNINTSTLRKLKDGQYDQEAAQTKAVGRAAADREDLLKIMAKRIDALSATRPAADNRLATLREIYPQFELYQERYEQAESCDERMENFFTLKGLALSLLTLAGYDQAPGGASELLHTWKRVRFAGCGKT